MIASDENMKMSFITVLYLHEHAVTSHYIAMPALRLQIGEA